MSTTPSRHHTLLIAELRAAGCVFAEEEARLLYESAGNAAELTVMLNQRCQGTPLEHVIGSVRFAGSRVHVDSGVFVPRARSEALVRRVVHHPGHDGAPTDDGAPTVIELCCGTGAVALAVSRSLPVRELHAADLDPRAVQCARRNLAGVATVHQGDLFAALPARLAGRVNTVVVNAPYVPTADIDFMPRDARLHEPRTALDGGADGLDLHRRLAAEAPSWLAPGGSLFLEIDAGQVPLTHDILTTNGMQVDIEHSPGFDATVAIGTIARRDTDVTEFR